MNYTKNIILGMLLISLLAIPVFAQATGSPFRGLSRLILTSVTGNTSYAVSMDNIDSSTALSDQPDWTLPNSGTVTLVFTWSTNGTVAWSQADTVTIYATDSGGVTQFGSTAWNPAISGASGSLTHTFNISTDPLGSSTTHLGGLLSIYLKVQRSAAVAWGPCDNGGTCTPPSGATYSNDFATGYYRENITANTFSVSNVSLGGATDSLYVYNDSSFTRLSFNKPAVRAYSVRTAEQQSSSDIVTSTKTTSTTSPNNIDVSFNSISTKINNKFAKSNSGVDILYIIENQSFGGNGNNHDQKLVFDSSMPTGFTFINYTTIKQSSSFTADPRLNASYIMQINNNTFMNPFNNLNVTSRLTSQIGFTAAMYVDANGNGVNNLNWIERLFDINMLTGSDASPTLTQTVTSKAQAGVNGIGASFLSWTSQLPTGKWIYDSNVTNDFATGLDVNNATNLTLLARDPSISLVGGQGNYLTSKDSVVYPGHTILFGSLLTKFNGTSSIELPSDSVGMFTIGYLNDTSGDTYYLNSTYSWVKCSGSCNYYYFKMSPDAIDSNVSDFVLLGGNTSNWAYGEYIVNFISDYNGVNYPYANELTIKALSGADPKYASCDQTTSYYQNISCELELQYTNSTPLTGQSPTFNVTYPDGTVSVFIMKELSFGNYIYSINATQTGIYQISMNNTLNSVNYGSTVFVNVQNSYGLNTTQANQLAAILANTTNIVTNITIGLGATQQNLTAQMGIFNQSAYQQSVGTQTNITIGLGGTQNNLTIGLGSSQINITSQMGILNASLHSDATWTQANVTILLGAINASTYSQSIGTQINQTINSGSVLLNITGQFGAINASTYSQSIGTQTNVTIGIANLQINITAGMGIFNQSYYQQSIGTQTNVTIGLGAINASIIQHTETNITIGLGSAQNNFTIQLGSINQSILMNLSNTANNIMLNLTVEGGTRGSEIRNNVTIEATLIKQNNTLESQTIQNLIRSLNNISTAQVWNYSLNSTILINTSAGQYLLNISNNVSSYFAAWNVTISQIPINFTSVINNIGNVNTTILSRINSTEFFLNTSNATIYSLISSVNVTDNATLSCLKSGTCSGWWIQNYIQNRGVIWTETTSSTNYTLNQRIYFFDARGSWLNFNIGDVKISIQNQNGYTLYDSSDPTINSRCTSNPVDAGTWSVRCDFSNLDKVNNTAYYTRIDTANISSIYALGFEKFELIKIENRTTPTSQPSGFEKFTGDFANGISNVVDIMQRPVGSFTAPPMLQKTQNVTYYSDQSVSIPIPMQIRLWHIIFIIILIIALIWWYFKR